MPIQPCFNVNKTDHASFRGSISGLGFAYCDFSRKSGRVDLATTSRARAETAAAVSNNNN
jgi:hypothetical protein